MEYTQRVLLYEDGSQLHHLGIESLVIIRPAALASDGLWKITDETASSGVLKSCINVTADNSGMYLAHSHYGAIFMFVIVCWFVKSNVNNAYQLWLCARLLFAETIICIYLFIYFVI